ncbi:MAG: hypothetical protein ABGX24_06165 [Aquificota bacterium]|jgi:hypothetical protein
MKTPTLKGWFFVKSAGRSVYHLFTLFWVPINAIFYLLMGTVEKLTEKLTQMGMEEEIPFDE